MRTVRLTTGEWIQCDLEHQQVPLPDETADFVYSSHVIEHVENPYVLLDEQLRLCKKGGVVAVVAPLGTYNRQHRHILEVNDIVGMLRSYGQPIFVYTDLRQSEIVAGIIRP